MRCFTPIINFPEVAILGVGKSEKKQIFLDGKFVTRVILPLSLSYDHRIMNVFVSNLNSFFSFFASNNNAKGIIAKKPTKNLTELKVNGPISVSYTHLTLPTKA